MKIKDIIVIATPINKDTLLFNGTVQGKQINNILVSNRTFEEGETYLLSLTNVSIAGSSVIGDVKTMRTIKEGNI